MAFNLSKLKNYFLFIPALAAILSSTLQYLLTVLCAKQRPTWITNDLVGNLEWLNMAGFFLLGPLFIVISVVVLIKIKNNRRIIVAALVTNMLAMVYFILGPALFPFNTGDLYDVGRNRISFKDDTEGCDLDSNFTTVESADDMAWDGGWICYRCQYTDTAALRSWFKANGLTQTELYNTDRVTVDDLLPHFNEKRPSWLPRSIGTMEFFQKQIIKNIGNNMRKAIDIAALLDAKNKILYVHIDKR